MINNTGHSPFYLEASPIEVSSTVAALKVFEAAFEKLQNQSLLNLLEDTRTDAGEIEPLFLDQIPALCRRLSMGNIFGLATSPVRVEVTRVELLTIVAALRGFYELFDYLKDKNEIYSINSLRTMEFHVSALSDSEIVSLSERLIYVMSS